MWAGMETARCDSPALQLSLSSQTKFVKSQMGASPPTTPTVRVTGNILVKVPGGILDLKGKPLRIKSDFNCFHRISRFQKAEGQGADGTPTIKAFKDWQKALGQDARSIQADPQFVDPEKGYFRLGPNSPCRGRGPKKAGKPTDMGVDWDEFMGKKQ